MRQELRASDEALKAKEKELHDAREDQALTEEIADQTRIDLQVIHHTEPTIRESWHLPPEMDSPVHRRHWSSVQC